MRRRLLLAIALALVAAAPASGAATPAVLVEVLPGTPAAAAGPDARPSVPPPLARALEARAGGAAPDLGRWRRVEAADAAQARAIARRLDARPGVRARVVPAPAPPPATCPVGGSPAFGAEDPTPDLAPRQPQAAAHGLPAGAEGAGVRIATVEYGWRRSHEELADRGLPAPAQPDDPPAWWASVEDHGTAVLGVIGARPDGRGVTGMSPAAELRPLSPYSGGAYGPARAIAQAALELRPGDVLLVEQQAWAGAVLGPIEIYPDVRASIEAAVAAGVVVVEPAGNGGADLAALHPSLTRAGDSGAIVVGAGGVAGSPSGDLRRTPTSNHGERVDVQGVGERVVTSGYGDPGWDPDPDRRYTACFDGSSSASATVAAAAAALQGEAIALRGAPLAPADLRRILVATGRGPEAGEGIGPRPDVAAAVALLAAPAPPTAPPAPPTAPPAPLAPARPAAGVPDPAPPAPAGLAPAPASVPGPPAAAAPAPAPVRPTRPAARGLTAVYRPRLGALVLRFRGLAPAARATARGRALRLSGGRAVLSGVGRGRVLVVRVRPSAGAAGYRPSAFRVTVPRRGPVRVRALR